MLTVVVMLMHCWFLFKREEEKQRERLRQEQNLREVADRVATAQQATEQAEEEDDEAVIEDGNGRNVVAILDEDVGTVVKRSSFYV